jgi:hypothetical protein
VGGADDREKNARQDTRAFNQQQEMSITECVCATSARSKQSIAGITKAREDVSVCIQLAIERGRDHTDIRMLSSEILKSFRCGDETQKTDARCAGALQRSHGDGASTGGVSDREAGSRSAASPEP